MGALGRTVPRSRTVASSATLALIEKIVDAGQRKLARRLLLRLTRHHKPTRRLNALVSRAWLGQPSIRRISDMRLEHLKHLIKRPIETRDYCRILSLVARYENLARNPPVAAGDIIARQMVSEKGRARINAACELALKSAPKSVYLLYLRTACMAKAGDYVEASAMIGRRIDQVEHADNATVDQMKRSKRELESLRNAWRVVDQIAREDTGWLDGEGGGTYTALVKEDTTARSGATTQSWALNFKEPLLQSRDETRYLALCQSEFNQAPTLVIKLKLIKEMLREGVRRQLTYHVAYDQANACYDRCTNSIDELLATDPETIVHPSKAISITQSIVLAIDVARSLKRDDRALEMKRASTVSRRLPGSKLRAGWFCPPCWSRTQPNGSTHRKPCDELSR